MNIKRVVQAFCSFLQTTDEKLTMWRSEQELARIEYTQSFSQRPLDEGHMLVTLKLRNDLEKLKESQSECSNPKRLDIHCQNPDSCQEQFARAVN